jgi:hypothetical protein
MLTIDETGMPKAPTLKQLLDRDVSLLYTRDKSPNKEMYVKEVGVIYYLGDPKGPCLPATFSCSYRRFSSATLRALIVFGN